MIFHELCHSMIQGPDSVTLPDWGLNEVQETRGPLLEHACLRLQALLSRPYGLHLVLAPTTDFREFYDALPENPLGDDESSRLARQASQRVNRFPWAPHVETALRATEAIVRATASSSPGRNSVFSRLAPRVERHVAGFPLGSGGSCGTCTWRSANGKCLQANVRVDGSLPSCERWEAAGLDCQQCGACCREGYDTVEIGPRDPVRKAHPDLVVLRHGRPGIARDGVRCAALTGGTATQPYSCRIYADRPKPCRDLPVGSTNCLIARRRVGLSR